MKRLNLYKYETHIISVFKKIMLLLNTGIIMTRPEDDCDYNIEWRRYISHLKTTDVMECRVQEI